MAEIWDIYDMHGNKTGRLHERGKPVKKEDYFLTVQVWILNGKDEFLISRRTPDRGHKWHTTGGAAVAGDDSITTALKETKEEIGIVLEQENGVLFKRIPRLLRDIGDADYPDEGGYIIDVWLFRQEVDINKVILQEEEVCGIMWADKNTILHMVRDETFVDLDDWYPYFNEFMDFCGV